MLFDLRDLRESTAGEDFGEDESDEAHQRHRRPQLAFRHLFGARYYDGASS
jgi:hypothetical protein